MARGPTSDYLDRYLARHETRATQALTLLGDVCYVGGPLLGALSRRPRVLLGGVAAGAALTALAHVFQPGTLADELRETLRHPVWAARAEVRRLRGGARSIG